MTDKELHKLKRSELLELMLEQSKEITRLKRQQKAMEKQLRDREIAIQEVGSIAEASLALSKVFAEAQQAADLYLENVERICKQRAEQNGAVEEWGQRTETLASQESSGDAGE